MGVIDRETINFLKKKKKSQKEIYRPSSSEDRVRLIKISFILESLNLEWRNSHLGHKINSTNDELDDISQHKIDMPQHG